MCVKQKIKCGSSILTSKQTSNKSSCGIIPIVVRHISTDISITVKHDKFYYKMQINSSSNFISFVNGYYGFSSCGPS